MLWRNLLAAGLGSWMAVSGLTPLWAAPRAQEGAAKLKIVILEGEGAINNIRQRTAREPIVQVQDENNRPVAGAVVLFTLPDRGASGVFANGAKSMTLTTDAQGKAVATGLKPNTVAGKIEIRVNASHQGQTASATITQTNVPGAAAAGAGAGKIIAILAIAGGAAAGAALGLGGKKNGGSAPAPTPTPGPTPTSVSAGTPSISPPPR